MIIRAKLYDDKRTYRDIAVAEYTNLYTLAEHVLNSFGFYHDHCFGFFSSPDIFGKGKDVKHYELFYDIGEEVDEYTESVARTLVNDLFQAKKDKWWMLFDYGDNWIFEIECRDVEAMPESSGTVTGKNGTSPKQYATH